MSQFLWSRRMRVFSILIMIFLHINEVSSYKNEFWAILHVHRINNYHQTISNWYNPYHPPNIWPNTNISHWIQRNLRFDYLTFQHFLTAKWQIPHSNNIIFHTITCLFTSFSFTQRWCHVKQYSYNCIWDARSVSVMQNCTFLLYANSMMILVKIKECVLFTLTIWMSELKHIFVCDTSRLLTPKRAGYVKWMSKKTFFILHIEFVYFKCTKPKYSTIGFTHGILFWKKVYYLIN